MRPNQPSNPPLSSVAIGHDNNLAVIRLICSFFVILSHSFALRYGAEHSQRELLDAISRGSLGFGAFAVGCFFFFGGYLIAGSAVRSHTGSSFFKKRLVRLLPELLFLVIFLAFILGPLFSSLGFSEYFGSNQVLLFLLNAILIPYHYLPGLFMSNPYPDVVDGSLWTLPVEFCCYLFVFCAYKLTHFDKKRYLAACSICLIPTIGYLLAAYPAQVSIVRPVILYWLGTTAYVFRDSIRISRKAASISLAAFLCLLAAGLSDLAMIVCFPVFVTWAAFYATPLKASLFLNKHELSYGIYLWGWPMGQIVVQAFPTIDVHGLSLLSFILAGLFGMLGLKASNMLTSLAHKAWQNSN